MDQVARDTVGAALYFDEVAPAPLPTRRLANPSNVLPKLVLLHPPEPSTSYFREQKKPINIFKKLIPKLESRRKDGGRYGDSGVKEWIEQKTGSWDVEWSVTPPSVKPSDALSVESRPSSSIYCPQSALIEALGLAFDRPIPVDPLSYSQPGVSSQNGGSQGQGVTFSSPNVKPTRSQTRVFRRKSRYPHPMILSPPRCSQASPAPSKTIPRGTHGRKSSSSSRRTSRSLMVGHNSMWVTASTNPQNKMSAYTYRGPSVFSSPSSIIQAAEIDQPLTGIHGRPSPRHIHALERTSKVPPLAKLILPPVEIHPLTFSPFLAEFGDNASSVGGSSALSTPSIITPPSDIASLPHVSPQMDIRRQKHLRRYGRCPSDFLVLGPGSPIALSIEQPRTDITLATIAPNPLPMFDSLRGCSREKAIEVAEKTGAEETKSVPSKASLRPKLTVQIPKTSGPSQRIVIHRPVASIRHCTDDIKIGTRRPLPTIPRQQSM